MYEKLCPSRNNAIFNSERAMHGKCGRFKKVLRKSGSDAARQREHLSWGDYAKRLNKYLQRMETLFWPDLFIIGGGISKESEKFLPLLTIETPIIPAQLLNEAGIVGAALAVRNGA